MAKYAQPILFFFCRRCADYHEKTHPHFAEQQARSAERKKAAKPKQRKKRG